MSFTYSFFTTIRVGLYSFKNCFATRGVLSTLDMFKEALIDEIYNRRYGLDVGGFFDPSDYHTKIENIEFANYYQPVRFRPFYKLFKDLNISPEGTFVDIGSGKGKAMLLAADIGFRKIIGLDIFDNLNNAAKSNIAKYKTLKPPMKSFDFQVLTQDATKFQFEPSHQIIFMNDPFSEEVMKPFISNLVEALKKNGQHCFIIYKNNGLKHHPSFYHLREVGEYSTKNYSGNYFEIFECNIP